MSRMKVFSPTDEMERDIGELKNTFKTKFGFSPSNTVLINFLIKAYKESGINFKRQPRSKKKTLFY